jgi:hypothetical protein
MVAKEDVAIALICLAIILYILWYLLTHSPQFVSYSDLFTVWGGTLTVLGLLLNRVYTSLEKIENRMNSLEKEISLVGRVLDKIFPIKSYNDCNFKKLSRLNYSNPLN